MVRCHACVCVGVYMHVSFLFLYVCLCRCDSLANDWLLSQAQCVFHCIMDKLLPRLDCLQHVELLDLLQAVLEVIHLLTR